MSGTLVILAAGTGGRGEEFGKSSPVGLLVIVLLAIALVFLIRSMNKHLRRVPESFDPPAEDVGTEPAAPVDGAATPAEPGTAERNAGTERQG